MITIFEEEFLKKSDRRSEVLTKKNYFPDFRPRGLYLQTTNFTIKTVQSTYRFFYT